MHRVLVGVVAAVVKNLGPERSKLITLVVVEPAFVIRAIRANRQPDLSLVRETLDCLSRLPGFTQGRQQDGNEQRNDRNHHEKLDQRKGWPVRTIRLG